MVSRAVREFSGLPFSLVREERELALFAESSPDLVSSVARGAEKFKGSNCNVVPLTNLC